MKRLTLSDDAIAWFVIFAFAAWLLVGCSKKCAPCAKPIPPAPIVTVVKPPPCALPDLPDPLPAIGVPDAQRDGYFVPRQSWAALGGYQSQLIAWVRAAHGCLTAPKP